MSFELNEKVKDMQPYEPISGEYRIRLDANESFITPDDDLKARLYDVFSSTVFNRYPDPLASDACDAFARLFGTDSRFVTAFNGSDESIFVIMNAFVQKGDTVVTLDPDFSMYSIYANTVEANVEVFEKSPDDTIDFDALAQFVKEKKARLVIFSNPCNPTGAGADSDVIKNFISSVDALVIDDEAYMDFWDDPVVSQASEYDNLIVLRTCSKALGFAALRLGFAVCNEKLTAVLRNVKSPYNVNSLTAALCAEVLSDKEYLDSCSQQIKKSVSELYEGLRDMRGFSVRRPDTNFVYIKTDDAPLIYDFFRENGIAVRYFEPDHLRITAGSTFENAEVISLMKRFFLNNDFN